MTVRSNKTLLTVVTVNEAVCATQKATEASANVDQFLIIHNLCKFNYPISIHRIQMTVPNVVM